jgi:hypothetical protein
MSSLMRMFTKHDANSQTKKGTALLCLCFLIPLICALAAVLFTVIQARSAKLPRQLQSISLTVRSAISPVFGIGPKALQALQERGELVADTAAPAALVVEHNFALPTSYTVRVRLPGGPEQFIPVTAPPGGLQLEVRDMTGDNVPNDLVLRPALIHWPLIVLLNDGHDHFTLAISASLPTSLNPSRHASQSREMPETAALGSSSSKTGPQANRTQILALTWQRGFLPPLAQRVPSQDGYRSVLGRAPPSFGTRA